MDRVESGHYEQLTIRNRPLAAHVGGWSLALGDKTQPMGIAEYRLVESLPAELQTSLPSIELLEQALANEAGEDDA